MDKIFIGKYVNTHGVHGEIRIKSDFENKNLIFTPGATLIIKNHEYIIKSYRVHKGFDMVTFEGINNINDILEFKGSNVFCYRDQISSDLILADILNMDVVLDNVIIGKVLDYTNDSNPLIIMEIDNKTVYIPNNDNFIDNISKEENKLYLKEYAKELM